MAKKPKPNVSPIAQALIDNMEVIYWAMIEGFAHGMLIQAVEKRNQEAGLKGEK